MTNMSLGSTQRNELVKNVYLWSLSIGIGLSIVTFLSNWLGLIHSGETPNTSQLIDISFYYFIPLISWITLTSVAIKYGRIWNLKNGLSTQRLFKLLLLIIMISPFIRIFDILIDFTIKYLLGMIAVSPFKVLKDVWMVVVFSAPFAVFKLLVIIAIVFYFQRQYLSLSYLTIRTSNGTYHQVNPTSIQYIQADGNYLILVGNEEYRIRNTLKSIIPTLGNDFYRIHKSTVINRSFVKLLKHWRNGEYLIVMSDDKPLTSSKSYKHAINQLKDFMRTNSRVAVHPNSATIHPTVA